MGAMHNDLNRCNFMYADDRRCRNLIRNPGDPFCFYHSEAARKRSEPATPTPADPIEDDVAARVFIEWLSIYSLDTATHLNQALNQLFFLLLRNRISGRQADSLLRAVRLMLKTVPDVREEFQLPGLRAHALQGDRFLAQLRELTAFAAHESESAAAQDSESAPHSVAATFRSPDFADSNHSEASQVTQANDGEDHPALQTASFASPSQRSG
ncbi:MAG: hypothetical protein ACRD5G_03445 [Candidatus Acidiferrales bacterium]